jgi:putative endonuclease
MSGAVSYHRGRVAEDRVAALYAERGHAITARRWRGKGGEIDLIARIGAALVFIEVKAARSLDAAAACLRPAQIQRLLTAAEEYMGGEPAGLLTEARFDVALVDGAGRIEVLENALV